MLPAAALLLFSCNSCACIDIGLIGRECCCDSVLADVGDCDRSNTQDYRHTVIRHVVVIAIFRSSRPPNSKSRCAGA